MLFDGVDDPDVLLFDLRDGDDALAFKTAGEGVGEIQQALLAEVAGIAIDRIQPFEDADAAAISLEGSAGIDFPVFQGDRFAVILF